MAWNIGRPGSGGGAGFNFEEHENHLLAFVGVHSRPNEQTKFGIRDAAGVAYAICIDDGTVVADALFFQTVIVPSLLEGGRASEIVLARVGKGEAKGGQNPPWLMYDPSDEDVALAAKWFDKYAVRMPSGTIVVEVPEHTDDPF